ncbi:ester cyclase [uncultured Eudoraea sp.]|uniref:ester cyclase n=1 Tax=uncultured Eudoraea sp. TaxID=1035614 RepID=UPI002632C433|nr:ester cyclase [uncultured Eudoraea sp.]
MYLHTICILFFLPIFLLSCQPKPGNSDAVQAAAPETIEPTWTQEEAEIKTAVDNLLIAAGNYDLEALDKVVFDNTNLGISSLKDGAWSSSVITIDEYFEDVKNRNPIPYCEIINDYNILVSESQMAFVRGDAIVHRFGIPQTREINHFTLLKQNGVWKFLNVSFTVNPIDEEKKKFDLEIFARSYAQAWCSKRPEFVASYFAKDGSLQVNKGAPARGTEEITEVAKGFMEAFPDIIVTMDSLVTIADKARFHWTLTGTNTGPGGTGNKVKISGFEEWTLDENQFIKESKGNFDEEDYNKQLEGL